jgi:Ca2+-binding EF-hand superfamily protein
VPYQEQLRDALSQNAVRVIDLFREWDEDGSGTVSKKEFRKAMPMLGLDVPAEDVDALFDSWDPDGSGMLELNELTRVLKGHAAA